MNYTRDEFRTLADSQQPTLVKISAQLDVEVSPLTAYAELRDEFGSPYSFLLESADKIASSDPDGAFRPSQVTKDRHARYSFIGYDPDAVISFSPECDEITTLSDRT
ncbi:MAG: anthranilate synthase component I, partial [Halobacteriaceae archaeon]